MIIFMYFKHYLFLSFSSTGNDEMCNFYMMYWVDGDQLLNDDVCTSSGPPHYYFGNDPVHPFFLHLQADIFIY